MEAARWRTYHDELDGDGQEQLLSVVGIDFFDHTEDDERNRADQQLRHLSVQQVATEIHQSLSAREGEIIG